MIVDLEVRIQSEEGQFGSLDNKFPLKNVTRIGQIAQSGRYKGKPLPYASLTLSFIDSGVSSEIDFLTGVKKELKKLDFAYTVDINLILLEVDVDQANLFLDTQLLKIITGMGDGLSISCYTKFED